MDRQFLAGALALLVFYAGCSQSNSDTNASPAPAAPDTAAMAAPASAEPAPSEEETTVPMNGRAAAPPPSLHVEFNAEPAPPPPATEPSLAVPPAALSRAPISSAPPAFPLDNPLRLDFEPHSSGSLRGNPLRGIDEKSGPRDSVLAGSAPETAPPPAGGSSFPAEFAPASQPAEDVPTSLPADNTAITAPARAQGAAAIAPQVDPFDEVEVFYGTDRQSTDRVSADWSHLALNFLPTGLSALLTLCVGLIAVGRRSFGLAFLSLVGVGTSVGLGYQASAATLTAIRQIGTEGPRYTTERSAAGSVEMGVCKVTIPRTHKIGEVESPSITRLEVHPDVARHVVLQKTERLQDDRFYELLKSRTLASPRRELFVFIHGFNVSFEDAARRTAQIHYDLKFAGAPLFFSWPANNKFILTYPADETNVAWSVPHLKQFLLSIVKESQAQSINVIAHSMGNRALAAALREIDLELQGQSRLFNQVILAAPDIDADEFRHTIAPAMQRTAKQLTLYASARDDALLASQLVHRGPRAGDAGSGLVVVPGIDTIDVTAIDSSPWGHSYYGSSDPVLNDLRTLFTQASPARERTWLTPAQRGDLTYWIFQAARTAAGPADLSR